MEDMPPGADAETDGELLARTRAGDRDAFGVLYERRHELVLAFLLKRTRNPEVAMDLMAETFAASLLALADRPPEINGSAAPWLLTIARNALIDDYQAKAAAYNKDVEDLEASQESYASACGNRRYDDRDLADIQRKK